MTEANGPGHAAILRAAGHSDAADLVDAINETNAKRAADEADPPRPTTERQPTVPDPEAARQAEAQYMLACLRRDLPGLFDR